MPFGYYEAELHPKKKKPGKPPKPVPPVENKVFPSIDQLPEPPVAYPENPAVPETPALKPVTPVTVGNVMNITIMVVGRGMGETADFLCGLECNANSIVSERGMALFANDGQVSNELIRRQKMIGKMLENADPYENAMTPDENGRVVTLMLSRSGYQSFSVQLNFVCLNASQAAAGLAACNAVWVLTDEPVYEGAGGDFCSAASAVLNAAKAAGIPAFLVLTQFERYGRVRAKDHLCSIEYPVYRDLGRRVKAAIGDSARGVPMIPVQVYGGQVFHGDNTSDHHVISSYKPEGCHIPLLMTIVKVNTGSQFEDNELILDVKALDRAQQSEFLRYSIELGG